MVEFFTSITELEKKEILEFLPYFKNYQNIKESDLSFLSYSSEIHDFIISLYKNNFVQVFDWMSWQDSFKTYVDFPERIDSIEIIVRILTTIIRSERFNDGSLGSYIHSGIIFKILQKVEELT